MSKRRIYILVLVAGSLIMLIFLMNIGSGNPFATTTEYIFPRQLDQVAYDLIFNPDDSALSVTMDWAYINREQYAIQDIVLRFYSRAFENENTSPAAQRDIRSICYKSGFTPSGFSLHDLYWNGVPINYSFDQQDITLLRISIPPLASGEKGILRLRCVIHVPDCRYLFGKDEHVWALGHCLPFIAQQREGRWQDAQYPLIGDPCLPACADYHITLTLPKGFLCAAGTRWQETASPAATRLSGSIFAARDVALVVSDQFHKREKIFDGILIQSYAKSSDDAERSIRYAEKALRYYSAEYGRYPYPVYTVASLDLPFDGAEFSSFSMVSSALNTNDSKMELAIAHETAHQWFGMLVGSDPILNAWQDEAPCEYAALQYMKHFYGMNAYEQLVFLRADAPMRETVRPEITVGSPVSLFTSYEEYGVVVYGRGLSMMLSLENNINIKDFFKQYLSDFAWKTASREDFIQMLSQTAGWDVYPMILDYLDTAI